MGFNSGFKGLNISYHITSYHIYTQCTIPIAPNLRMHSTSTLCAFYLAVVLFIHVARKVTQRNMTVVGAKSTAPGARYTA